MSGHVRQAGHLGGISHAKSTGKERNASSRRQWYIVRIRLVGLVPYHSPLRVVGYKDISEPRGIDLQLYQQNQETKPRALTVTSTTGIPEIVIIMRLIIQENAERTSSWIAEYIIGE